MKIIALTPQRLARRSKRCFRSRGGKRLLRAIERNLALRGKQARERWSRERKENTLGSVYKCNWSSLCFWEILLSSAFGFRKCCFVARRGKWLSNLTAALRLYLNVFIWINRLKTSELWPFIFMLKIWRSDSIKQKLHWSFRTFHGFGLDLTVALTHRVEKLVHLLQGKWVVQRLQRVDGRHHGASFKACRTKGTIQPIVY